MKTEEIEPEQSEFETVQQEKRIFEKLPVPKAVMAMVLPTILSQIIFVLYNLADTWYVGLTEDANAVAAICSESFSLICTTISCAFAPQLVSVFIRDAATVYYGTEFLRVICLAVPVYTLTFVAIAFFQAIGRGIEPFLLSVLHKGTLDIVMMYLIIRRFGTMKIVWATPVSEVVALVVAGVLLWKNVKQSKQG